jgi:hypothetical protein
MIVLNFNDSHYNSSQLGSRVGTNNLMEIRVAHLLLWLEKGNQIHDLNEYGDSLLVWWEYLGPKPFIVDSCYMNP